MPITSMDVPNDTTRYAFQGVNCRPGFAPVIQVNGEKPSPPMLKDYHTFYCVSSCLDKDPRVSISVHVCDNVSCHKHLCAQGGECMRATRHLSRPITSMTVPKGQNYYVYTGLTCGGD